MLLFIKPFSPFIIFFFFCLPELNIGITKRLKNTEIQEGEDCTFECILSHESIGDFNWTLNGNKVGSGGRFKASNAGRKYTLSIKNVIPDDSGEVIFTARGLTSKASLVVKGNEIRKVLGLDFLGVFS